LINDILDLSRVEAGRMQLQVETMDVPTAVESALRIVRDRADEQGVDLVAEVPGDLPLLEADPTRVRQMLVNLLVNAVKFSDLGSRVTLQVACDTDGLTINVVDQGIGIAPEDQERIFNPFQQATGDIKWQRNRDGVGLGLSLVRHFAELHGGRVELSSTLGVGTRVTIHLPAARLRPRRAADRSDGRLGDRETETPAVSDEPAS
jgi:cell cycle sensor histidine kinase DivJ